MFEPKIIGKSFNIFAELSSGGFGQTFLAEDLRFPDKPKCVIKQLKIQSDDPKMIDLASRLFEQEVSVLYHLGEHPQIPSLIAHFEENGEFYLVQEYVAGNTFAQELEHGKIYNHSEVIEITTQLLDILSFVHSRKVIHRDVKPANLINQASDGKIVLIDFGAVKQVRNQVSNPHQPTHNTIAIGSDGYMPFEQLGGQPKFSSDVYAVGMFAIQLLTQTHPTQFNQNQRTGEWVWQHKASVNPHFAEVLNQMIRYDYRQRFANASDASDALKRLNIQNHGNLPQNRNQNQVFEQSQNFGSTNATYSLPIPAYQENQDATRQVNYQQTRVEPKFQQPPTTVNQAHYYPVQPIAPMIPQQQFVRPPIQIDKSQLGISENISLSGIGFDDFRDNAGAKGCGYVLVVMFASIFCIYLFMNKQQESNHLIQPQQSVPKKVNQAPYKNLALQKEARAKTSDDWINVANEWKMAEEYYTVAEMSASDLEEKSQLKREKDHAYERRTNAIRRSDQLRAKLK